MDGGAWWATVHGVAESDMTEWFHFTFTFKVTNADQHSKSYVQKTESLANILFLFTSEPSF